MPPCPIYVPTANADCNKTPKILKELEHIQFHKLIGMELNNNDIYSIECMGRMYMPQLKYFWISSSISIFRVKQHHHNKKRNQGKLASFDFDVYMEESIHAGGNFIMEYESLSRMQSRKCT